MPAGAEPLKKLLQKQLKKWLMILNSKPQDITALIGPAIGFCCYNVGEEVLQKLSSSVKKF